MSFLLDTNVCSAYMRRPSSLAHRFVQYGSNLYISSITLAELYAGACLAPNPSKFQVVIADLLQEVSLLDFDQSCALVWGQLRAVLNSKGLLPNALDLLIASTALTHNLTLVTHNTKHLQHIPGLRLDDWLTP